MSHFWSLMEDELGEGYAATMARGHVVHALDDRTVTQALEDGVPPRAVWEALCDDLGIPPERRLGRDREPMDVPRSVTDSLRDESRP